MTKLYDQDSDPAEGTLREHFPYLASVPDRQLPEPRVLARHHDPPRPAANSLLVWLWRGAVLALCGLRAQDLMPFTPDPVMVPCLCHKTRLGTEFSDPCRFFATGEDGLCDGCRGSATKPIDLHLGILGPLRHLKRSPPTRLSGTGHSGT